MLGTALAYHFMVRDLVAWGMSLWAAQTPEPPPLEMAALMTVLVGLLGLGGLRTVEKLSGRAK